jgi:hypothetical protein
MKKRTKQPIAVIDRGITHAIGASLISGSESSAGFRKNAVTATGRR